MVTATGETSSNSVWKGLAIVVVAACLLLPFVNKPFHIDDTVFLRIAERIEDYPLDPYNFTYSWSAKHLPMWEQTLHPPLYSYFLAVVGRVAGYSEVAVHLACLPLALGCVWLMYCLACHFCRYPVTATLAASVAPAFLVSATTAMSDVPMYFCWLLAVHETVRAADTGRPSRLWIAGIAASAAAMTKYFGIALVPLLLVYWHAGNRRAGFNRSGRLNVNTFALWTPVVVLALWGLYSFVQIGRVHYLNAAGMAATYKPPLTIVGNIWNTVPYLGAAMLWPCGLLAKVGRLPRLWKWLLLNTFLAASGMYWLAMKINASLPFVTASLVLYAVMAVVGILILLLTLESCSLRRDLDTLLLGLWTFGTLFFVGVVNWTFNARVVLPAVFPATVLIVRWIELQPKPQEWIKWVRIAIVPSAAVTLLVATADYQYAAAVKEYVVTTVQKQIDKGRGVFFTGHWGFQWYLEEAGAVPLDASPVPVAPGDIIVQKSGSDNFFPEAPYEFVAQESKRTPLHLHTHRHSIHADFYAGVPGGLPFALNPDGILERFRMYRVL